MMGITNHWVTLIAHKFNQKTEFIYCDSRNRDYLDWSKDYIKQWIEEEN